MAFDARDLGKDLVKNAASITVGAVFNGGVDPTSVVEAAINVGALLWKAGAYLNHRSTVQTSLAACLEEYVGSGYLRETKTADGKPSCWTTTPKFSQSRPILSVYPDIAQYVKDEGVTDQELHSLGIDKIVTIHVEKTVVKGLGDIKKRLSFACEQFGVRDLTKTDADKRIAHVSDMQMGAIALQNAFTAEGQRRQRGESPCMVPVLGRVFGLVALCGITDIALGDITTVLGKCPVFETVARARIAKLRNAHASQVFNTLLFKGNSQSTARGFGQQAAYWAGERVVVGQVTGPRKSIFDDEYTGKSCELSGPPDRKHEVGKPVYMLAGWANLLKQRESFEKEHGTWTQMVHIHAPTTEKDVHGNTYMSAGKLGKVVFKVKEMPDGSLMAKPRKFDRFDYLCKADYDKGRGRSKATGEEKLFGGIVGPVVCKCEGTLNETKSGLTKSWKLGPNLKVHSRDHVANSISHTQELSTKHVSVLWRPGDWLMGVFMMSVLPQSSYMQGRGECLHCAVETAALTGCAEVIACGGGRVSREALGAADQTALVVSPPVFVETKALEQTKPPERNVTLETATALYSYESLEPGDLSFQKGDVIEILVRGNDVNQWWTGRLSGQQGQFPANYVKLDSLRPVSAVKTTLLNESMLNDPALSVKPSIAPTPTTPTSTAKVTIAPTPTGPTPSAEVTIAPIPINPTPSAKDTVAQMPASPTPSAKFTVAPTPNSPTPAAVFRNSSIPTRKPVASTATLPFTPPASPGPSSPPPAYELLSPSAPPASSQWEYFTSRDVGEASPTTERPAVRRKVVPVLAVAPTMRQSYSPPELDSKVQSHGLGVDTARN